MVTMPDLQNMPWHVMAQTGSGRGAYWPTDPGLSDELFWGGTGAHAEPPEFVSATVSTIMGLTMTHAKLLELLKTINDRGLIHGRLIRTEDKLAKKVTLGFVCVRGDLP